MRPHALPSRSLLAGAAAAFLLAGPAQNPSSGPPAARRGAPDLLAAVNADGMLLAAMGKASPLNPGGLARLDPVTLAGKLLGDGVAAGGLSGLVATPDGRVFGTLRTGATFHATDLVQLAPYTGAVLSRVPLTESGQEIRIADLALQPGTGKLYGIGQPPAAPPHALYTIDIVTGVATLVGQTGLQNDGGLAFAPDGTLYVAAGGLAQVLATLDPATGAVLTSISYGPDNGLHGLTVRPSDGALLGTRGEVGGGDLVVRIDPVTGLTTQLGSTGVGNAGDLAFLPPPQPKLELLAGIATGSPSNPGALVRVDEIAWSGTLLGDDVAGGGLTGLAATPDGRLFATANPASGGANTELFELDPGTGAVLSQIGLVDAAGGGPILITDLALQPGTGTVFGIGSDQAGVFFLYTIDTASGAAAIVGQPAAQGPGGLAFSPSGTLFYVQSKSDQAFTLNPATGASGSAQTYGPDTGLDGLAVRPSDGALLATRGGASGGDQIVLIDTTTGQTTKLGALGVGAASDLAFRLVPGFAPPATPRFASPPNPGQIAPCIQDRMILGASPAGIPAPDAAFTVPSPGATLVIVWAFSIAPDNLPLGSPGTLLISLAPPTVFLVAGLFATSDSLFVGAVPDAPELVGLPLYSQGAYVENGGGVFLTNAIDYVIGAY